jgi:deubiquitinase DESI2
MSSFGPRRASTEVYVNVYDLAPANDVLHPIGLGLYHTGVEIMGVEYTFASQSGIFRHTPKAVPQATFREQLPMGKMDGGSAEIKAIIDALGDEKFGPNDYHIIRNNCNHFASALCLKLLHKPLPGYINRLADIGNCCSCLIPKRLLEQEAPVTESGASPSSSFLVRAPMNRGGGGDGASLAVVAATTAFSGTGSKLGGGSSSSTNNSSSKASSTTPTDSLTDRREKARAAALARLELQQQQHDSDKSQ